MFLQDREEEEKKLYFPLTNCSSTRAGASYPLLMKMSSYGYNFAILSQLTITSAAAVCCSTNGT